MFHAKPAPVRAHSAVAPVLALALFLGLGACGLMPVEPVDFQSYPLAGMELVEAESLVQDVVTNWFTERYGGVELSWDEDHRNLEIAPIYEESRRLKLYVQLVEGMDGTEVEMLALVESLLSTTSGVRWGNGKKDVYLEQVLYQAMVDAIVARELRE